MTGKNDWRHLINFRNLIILIFGTALVFGLSVWIFGGWARLSWGYRIAWIAGVFVAVGGVMAFIDQLIIKKKQSDNKQTKINQTVVAGSIENSVVITGDNSQVTLQPPAPTYSPLHQLPPPPLDFTGRDDELNDLLQAVEKDGVVISGLHGMGGVGKTVLALKLAEQLKPKYPSTQIYLDLKGASDKPLTPVDIMSHVVHSYRPELKLPENEAELHGLYCSLLQDQQSLLLLDNAAGANQLEPILPPKTCLLLVTSRQHFTLPGLKPLNLDVLPPAHAVELILKIAPQAGKPAGEIAKLCGYLPFALRTSASILVTEANLTPDDLVRRLQDASQRLKLTGVEASLQVSYDLLDDNLKEKWRLLAVFPGGFDLQDTAAVWQFEPDPAQDALGQLLARSLLEYDPTGQRYRLHDLARLFVQQRCQPDKLYQTQKRFSTFYKDVLTKADDLYLQGGEHVLAGLALFDLEWDNIQSGQRWAAEQEEKDQQAGQLCVDYSNKGIYCLSLRLHPRQQIDWLQSGLAAARRLGDRRGEGAALTNLGIAYTDLGEPRRAIEYYEQSLQIHREIGDRRGEGGVLGNLVNAYLNLGEPRRAIEYYEQALQIDREIGDRRGQGIALGNLGLAYADLGEPRQAIEYHEQALQIEREIGDRHGEGTALGNLGSAYLNLDEPRRAIEYYEQALQLDREIGDRYGEGVSLGNLGSAYADLGETHRAIEDYEQRLQIAREIGDRRGEGQACWNMGLALAELGEFARAAQLMQILVDYELSIGHPDAAKDAAMLEEVREKAKSGATSVDRSPE